MTKFNPDFWEVTISEESWQQFTLEDGLYYESPEEVEKRQKRAERTEAIWPTVRAIMDEVLTARQREVIFLYFFEGLNQRQISEKLSISQQSANIFTARTVMAVCCRRGAAQAQKSLR